MNHDTAHPGPARAAADRDSVTDSWGRAAAYDAYADGLHTYALGGLRNHEAAVSAVYCAFIAADHHVAHLSDAEVLRPWLYAITRHYCRRGKLPRLGLTPLSSGASWDPGESGDKNPALAGLERSLLAAELASLDWPDTDGMQTAHREVLELSVRHGLESRAVGLMLARPADESFELLSQAWTELERSLAALAVLRTTREHCAQLAALAEGWTGRFTARTREPLLAHVDGCSHCQYYLHTVIGTPQAPTILPHVAAPSALRRRVLGDLRDMSPAKVGAKAAIAGRLAVFDRWGFPSVEDVGRPAMPNGRVARPGGERGPAADGVPDESRRSRQAAPGVALDLEDRPSARAGSSAGAAGPMRRPELSVAAPSEGGRRAAVAVGATLGGAGSMSRRSPSSAGAPAAPAAPAAKRRPASRTGRPSRHRKSALHTLGGSAVLSGAGAAGVTAFVLLAPSSPAHTTLFTPDPDSVGGSAQAPDTPLPTSGQVDGAPIPVAGGPGRTAATARSAGNPGQIVAAVVTTASGPGSTTGDTPASGSSGRVNVTVAQRANNPDEVTVTLWNSGSAPVAWTATPDAAYLHLSSASGVLQPGSQQSVVITVDQAAAPSTAWEAHVRFDPGGSTVAVRGTGTTPVPPPTSSPGSGSGSTPSSRPTTSPSSSPSTTPTSGPTASPSTSTPTSTGPTPAPTSTATSAPTTATPAMTTAATTTTRP